MGKIRVKTLGDEKTEKEQQKADKIKKEQKLARKSADGVAASDAPKETPLRQDSAGQAEEPKEVKTKKEKFIAEKKAVHSKQYQKVATLVDRKKVYSLSDALELLPKLKIGKFDETVELHINTTEAGITGSVTLPHGSGKQLRVAIADEKLIAAVEKGKIDFDILLAAPQMMPKLAKVARVLGPKGLMPNPKNGTITPNPEEAAKKFSGGLIHFKTEAKTPIIHLTVGKVSFGDKKLAENIKVVFGAIQSDKIKNITLKSTMSPGIKIVVS